MRQRLQEATLIGKLGSHLPNSVFWRLLKQKLPHRTERQNIAVGQVMRFVAHVHPIQGAGTLLVACPTVEKDVFRRCVLIFSWDPFTIRAICFSTAGFRLFKLHLMSTGQDGFAVTLEADPEKGTSMAKSANWVFLLFSLRRNLERAALRLPCPGVSVPDAAGGGVQEVYEVVGRHLRPRWPCV